MLLIDPANRPTAWPLEFPSRRTIAPASRTVQIGDHPAKQLSTGRRMLSAADDPSGLTTAQRMRAHLGGLRQGAHAVADGLMVTRTADSALDSVGAALAEVRTLAAAYRNGSLSDAERQTLQRRADELMKHVADVGANTEYNGVKLLEGPQRNLTIPVRADGAGLVVQTSDLDATIGTASFDLSSETAIADIDAAAERVTAERQRLGSVPFESAYESITRQSRELDRSRSTIEDVDMADAYVRNVRERLHQQVQIALLTHTVQAYAVLGLVGSVRAR